MSSEFLYCMCGIGVAAYLCSGISIYLRHRWSYPYNWYVGLFFFWALSFVPLFPFWGEFFGDKVAKLLIIPLSSIIPAILMLTFARLSNAIKRLNFMTVSLTIVPLIVARLSFEFVSNLYFNCVLLGLVFFTILWWRTRIIQRVNDYNKRIKDYISDLSDASSSWIKRWLNLVVIMIFIYLVYYFYLGVTDTENNGWTIVVSVFVILPCIITFGFQEERHMWFENFDMEYAPLIVVNDSLFSTPAYERKLKEQSAHRAHDLRHAKQAMERRIESQNLDEFTKKEEEEPEDYNLTLKEQFDRIDMKLSELEVASPFFADVDFSLDELADRLSVSRLLLTQYFHYMGTTFYNYIIDLRITFAVMIIDRKPEFDDDIVARRCGFRNVDTFQSAFKEVYHITPEAYRIGLRT